MKCNMCNEGDMNHQFVITNKQTGDVTVLSEGTDAYSDMVEHIQTVNSQKTADGHHITHIYNCSECPNSQLEYYQPINAEAYEKAMNAKATHYL